MNGRVLIIEDLENNRLVLENRLSQDGLDVVIAINGEEGIHAAVQTIPQIILLSTSLPDMSGVEVVNQLRGMTRTQHIWLMLIGDEENRQQRLDGLNAGANDFVTTPIDTDLLSLRVRNALQRVNMENTTDPVTGIPAGRRLQDELMGLLKRPEGDWALMRIRMMHVDAFREANGFAAGDDLLRATGQIIAKSLGEDVIEDDFLGYGGHEDFIIITEQGRVEGLQTEISAAFSEEVGAHYSFFDRERGYLDIEGKQYPLASLRVTQVLPSDGPFYDIRSLSEALAGN